MSIERTGGGYVKISMKKEDLEKSIEALRCMKPALQKILFELNGDDKRQAAIDVRNMGKDVDTAITAMIILLSGFNECEGGQKRCR